MFLYRDQVMLTHLVGRAVDLWSRTAKIQTSDRSIVPLGWRHNGYSTWDPRSTTDYRARLT